MFLCGAIFLEGPGRSLRMDAMFPARTNNGRNPRHLSRKYKVGEASLYMQVGPIPSPSLDPTYCRTTVGRLQNDGRMPAQNPQDRAMDPATYCTLMRTDTMLQILQDARSQKKAFTTNWRVMLGCHPGPNPWRVCEGKVSRISCGTCLPAFVPPVLCATYVFSSSVSGPHRTPCASLPPLV